MLLLPDEDDEDGEDEQRKPEAFPLLPNEQPWQAEARAAQCRQACRRVAKLVRDELGVNSTTLSGMVAWLLAPRPLTTVGHRLPAAVMESHMGATVDRSVYHPQLRAALRAQQPLGVVVPLSCGECGVPAQVLGQVGAALWKALAACQRETRARKTRSEREAVVGEPKLPSSVHLLQTVAELAAEWRREAGQAEGGPVHVVLLVEDFAGCDRRALRSLFRSLAEAQHGEAWCGGALAFSAVLWASAEAEIEAGLLDHLYWTRYPFLPAAAMLKNVLCAALLDTHLPFLLPAPVHAWIVTHFARESHSLAWLLHVLQTVIVHHYSTAAGSWVNVRHGCAPPDGFERELQRMFPPLQGRPESAVLQLWRQKQLDFESFRKRRMHAFVHLWRLLLRWSGSRVGPLLEEYGTYLTHCARASGDYKKHVFGLVREALFQDMQRRHDDVLDELRQLASDGGAQYPWLGRALAALEQEPEVEAAAQPQKQAAPAVPRPLAQEEYVLCKPKDALLRSAVASNPNVRAGAAAPPRAVYSSRRESPLLPPQASEERQVRGMLRCVEALCAELQPPTPAQFPMLQVSVYGGSEAQLPAMLWGDARRQALAQLAQPSWRCVCCRPESLIGDRKRVRTSLNFSSSSSTHEDVCIAFAFQGQGRIDFDAWEKQFLEQAGGETEAARVRFHRALRDLQCMGLACWSSNSVLLSKSEF